MFYIRKNIDNMRCKYITGKISYSDGDACFCKHSNLIELSTMYSLFEKVIQWNKCELLCSVYLPYDSEDDVLDMCIKDCTETMRLLIQQDFAKQVMRHENCMKGLDNVHVFTV